MGLKLLGYRPQPPVRSRVFRVQVHRSRKFSKTYQNHMCPLYRDPEVTVDLLEQFKRGEEIDSRRVLGFGVE